jgi:hypothetical protein
MDSDILMALLGACALATAQPARAQLLQPLAPGVRVRVTPVQADARPFAGEVLLRDDSALLVRVNATETRRVPFGTVRLIEVSRGMRSRARAGAKVGALAGLVAGLATGIATRPHGSSCHTSQGSIIPVPDVDIRCLGTIGKTVGWIAVTGTAGGLVGGGLGALIGGAIRTEVWEPLQADRIDALITPFPGGRLGLGLSVAF